VFVAVMLSQKHGLNVLEFVVIAKELAVLTETVGARNLKGNGNK